MTFLREWLLGIIACALLVSIARQLTPQGSGQKLVRFAGGLLLTLSMLRPAAQVDLGALEIGFEDYKQAVATLELALRAEQESELSESIAQRTSAYIEDKARAMGVTARAEVQTQTVDGVPLPVSVTIYAKKNEALSEEIMRSLGIAKERQTWRNEE